MARYSIEPRHQMFVKGYGFLSFAEKMSKNIDKNISKNLGKKYSQKNFYHAKQYTAGSLRTRSKSNSKNSKSNWGLSW